MLKNVSTCCRNIENQIMKTAERGHFPHKLCIPIAPIVTSERGNIKYLLWSIRIHLDVDLNCVIKNRKEFMDASLT